MPDKDKASKLTEIEKKMEEYKNLSSDYASVLNNMSDGIALFRSDSMRQHWYIDFLNLNFARINDMSYVETMKLYSADMFARICPEDRENVRRRIRDAAYSIRDIHLETRILQHDETYLWVSLSISFYGISEEVYRASVVLKDINERKQLELANEENTKRLTAAIEHASMLYWEFDIPNRTLYTKKFFLNGKNYPTVIKNFPDSYLDLRIVHPDSIPDFIEMHNEIMNGAEKSERNIKIYEDNSEMWYKVTYTNMFDDNGNPVRAFATATDINQYKELEERIKIATSAQGFYIWTLDLIEGKFDMPEYMSSTYGSDYLIRDRSDCERLTVPIMDEDIDIYLNMYNRLYAGDKTVTARVHKFNNVTEKWDNFRIKYTNMFDSDGRPFKAIGTAVNINYIVEAEDRYTDFNNYIKMLITDKSVVNRFNLTSNFIEVNGRFFSYDNYINSLFQKIEFPEDRMDFQVTFDRKNLLDEFAKGSSSVSVDFRISREDDIIIWNRSTINMVLNPNTNEVEGIVIDKDVTDEKVYNAAFEKLNALDFEYACVFDPKTEACRPLGEKSKNAYLGYDTETGFSERSHEIYKRLVYADVREEIETELSKESIVRELEKSAVYVKTYPVVHIDGSEGYARFRFMYLNPDKRAILFTRTDVTEIFKEEEQRRHVISAAIDEARKANDSKAAFFSNISHDMRTPMNGIIGLVNIMKKECNDPNMEIYLNKLLNTSEYMLNLINDTLDVSKLAGEGYELNYSNISVENFINEIRDTFGSLINDKGVKFTLNISELKLCNIRMDKIRVQQIFTNIISNAIKFTDKGGSVNVTVHGFVTPKMKLKTTVIVSDTGCGISDSYLEKIFEPFSQEYRPDRKNQTGTGLGMSIVKSLVDLMDGKIRINSVLNEGTEVIVTLEFDVVDEAKAQKKKVTYDYDSLNGKRVLICEDNEINMEIATKILSYKGIESVPAENGKIGYDIYMSEPEGTFDAVIMDINMPVMNGLDATMCIRGSNKADSKSIPIIAMTANAFEEDVQKGMKAGMNDYIVKPFVPEDLYNTLCIVLSEN